MRNLGRMPGKYNLSGNTVVLNKDGTLEGLKLAAKAPWGMCAGCIEAYRRAHFHPEAGTDHVFGEKAVGF